MARSVRAPHHSTEPTPLATALYMGLCLLALALLTSVGELIDAPRRSNSFLRASTLPLPAPPAPARAAELAPAPPAPPSVRLRSHAEPDRGAPAPGRSAPGDGGGLLIALRELASEGRLPSPSSVDGAPPEVAGPREVLADAGPLALPGEADGVNVRRGSDHGGTQRLGELLTAGAQEVSYGPKPAPTVDLDEDAGELAALAPAGGAATTAPLTAG